ncbi:MAG: GAF domain-containing protein [Phototrophicales bacterium]|nr:GAF domain-containing protein [Phototrophicales bacterium]
MRNLIQRLSFQFPIWARLALTIFIAISIPAVIAFVLLEREIRVTDLDNLRAYISFQGIERRNDVNTFLTSTSIAMSDFAENETNRNLLIRLMGFNSTVERVLEDLTVALETRLTETGLFSRVELFDMDGIVLLSNTNFVRGQRIPVVSAGTDKSGDAAYQTAQNAQFTNRSSALIATGTSDNPQIQVVYVVSNIEGAVGYVVGTVNLQTGLLPRLYRDSGFVEAFSYLATSDGLVIAQDDYREQALSSVAVSPILDALVQDVGTQVYSVGGEQYVGYYTPIENTPFAFITETPLQVSFARNLVVFVQQFPIYIFALIIIWIILTVLTNLSLVRPLQELNHVIQAVADGDYDMPISNLQRTDDIGALARTVANTREQVSILLTDLQERIVARVRDLQATQEVSRFAAIQREPQALMDKVVDLIIKVFPNMYHAQIFLLDDDEQFAILRASTGDAGRNLLARGHRLQVGSQSVIGRCTDEARVVIARDTLESEVHRKNEFLLETRAELAIPLKIGDKIIGALDVQSKFRDSFNDEQVNILQTMADQIAIAIENTRLYQESLRRLEELTVSNRVATRATWVEYMNYRREATLSSQFSVGTATVQKNYLSDSVLKQGVAIIGQVTDHNTIPFAIPIQLRGQTLGVVEWEFPVSDFSQEKVQLAMELVGRLALSLDNARLFEESQRAIERERLVNDIASKLTSQTEIDAILQTAVREVGQALRVPQVSINLALAKAASGEPLEIAPILRTVTSKLPNLEDDSSSDNGHSE